MRAERTARISGRGGFTRVELGVAIGVTLLLGGLMLFAVRYERRLSRDASTLSAVRQAQAALERFRASRLSYPGASEPEAPKGFAYKAVPEGCSSSSEAPCVSYAIEFRLEGRVGQLQGGACSANAGGVSCAAAR